MSWLERARALEEKGDPFVVVTFLGGEGHLPQEPGAKALVTREGLVFGTVGGGAVEGAAIELARALLAQGQRAPVQKEWNLQRDLSMTCGGVMRFLLEPQLPRAWTVVVYGAGHVAQALVRVLGGIDCRVVCIDPRAEWREKLPAQPRLTALACARPAERVGELPRGVFHVVVTQDHELDREVVAAIHAHDQQAPYVGVIGSRAKAGKLRRELQAAGVGDAFLERVLCPMGLPLGGSEPGEIAVSVAAQLLQVRDQARP